MLTAVERIKIANDSIERSLASTKLALKLTIFFSMISVALSAFTVLVRLGWLG